MARNSFAKTYADEKVGVNGLLYKAGLTELADTLAGYGRGYDGVEWFTIGGSGESISNGGLKCSASGNFSITPTDAAGRKSVIRESLMTRGALQIDLYADDLCDGSWSGAEFIRAYNDAGVTSAPIYLRITKQSLAINAYHSVVSDADGNSIFDSPVYVSSGSTVKTATCDASSVLHKDLANADGYITYGIDWYGNWQRHFINGKLVAEMPMDNYTGELQYFNFQKGVASGSMKNLLIYDRPFPRHNKPDIRVSAISHSFLTREQLGLKQFTNGTIGGMVGSTFDFSTLEAFSPKLYSEVNAEIEIFSTGFSGENLAYQEDRIINGTPTAYATGNGNYQDHVTRFRPHFCVLVGTIFNDNGTTEAALETSIHNITVFLMGKGIIPVWVLEHNRVDGSLNAEHGYALAELNRQVAINDIGVVDTWDTFGSTTAAEYRAYEAASNHWNFKSQPIYATLVAAEINRLLASPPNYSRLAGGNGEYMAISAP